MMVLNFVVMVFLLMLATALYAADTDNPTNHKKEYYEHEFLLLQHYRLIYADEMKIFDYCVAKHRKGLKSSRSAPFGGFAIGSKVGSCMRSQINIKEKILDYAQNQLGGRSLAQGIYNECTEYYPKSGATRISKCVKTRLMLDSKLDDDFVEKTIYQKCDFKWRKHGSGAINNCSITEANYYRDKGQLRD